MGLELLQISVPVGQFNDCPISCPIKYVHVDIVNIFQFRFNDIDLEGDNYGKAL